MLSEVLITPMFLSKAARVAHEAPPFLFPIAAALGAAGLYLCSRQGWFK
jgi:hypothetical protein